MSKTHFRKVFKSDHLGVSDLEELIEKGSKLIFTIKEVRQEFNTMVAGRKINANIAYFVEPIKPLVLNSTNSKIVKSFNQSPFLEDWSNTIVQLFIDENVKMKGEVVGGVRINPIQPKPKKKPVFTEDNFKAAKENNATIETIKKHYQITKEVEQKYIAYVG